MQPGGKPEAGENPETALIRELKEELNFSVLPEDLVPLGRFTDTAANEPGRPFLSVISAAAMLIFFMLSN